MNHNFNYCGFLWGGPNGRTMHPSGRSELRKSQPTFGPLGGERWHECGDSTWQSWTFWRMVPNRRGTIRGVVWLIFFSCFAAHLIGLLLDYITVLDLCNIFEFCKHSTLVSPYEGSLLFWFFDDKFAISLGNVFDFGHAIILFPLLID